MKYLFVAGLEHSGSTLIDHLLSQHPRVLGLGEVASFFSPTHMKHYMDKWGEYPDVTCCSCGCLWHDCPFWSQILELNGLNTDWPMSEKYSFLFDYVRSKYKNIEVIVDSSKDIGILDDLVRDRNFSLNKSDIFVLFVAKDARSFAASIAKKTQKTSPLNHIKTFNLWRYSNQKILEYLRNQTIPFIIVLYERLCLDPEHIVESILAELGLKFDMNFHALQNTSHIAMGNKNFTVRNKERIRYDDSWYLDDTINLAYMLHKNTRKFNKKLYFL